MTPGSTYHVTWLEDRDSLGVTRAVLRFEGSHPCGVLLFAYAVMGYQLAEANR